MTDLKYIGPTAEASFKNWCGTAKTSLKSILGLDIPAGGGGGSPPFEGNWGIESTSYEDANKVNGVYAMGGTFGAGDGRLTSVSVCFYYHSYQVRVAVYQGGSLTTGPAGATLVEDLGLTSGSGTGFVTVTSSANPTIDNSLVTWIVIKDNGNDTRVRERTNGANAEDFQSARGMFTSDGAVSSDETVGYPATWPADSGGFSSFWKNVYLTCEEA